MNFDVDKTRAEQQDILARRTTLAARVDGTAYSTAHLDTLRKLVLDLANLVLDDTQYAADTRFDITKVISGMPVDAEYRHEYLMRYDETYYHAWAYQFSPLYSAMTTSNPQVMSRVDEGFLAHTYFEANPDIVDRSLLRHHLRVRDDDEGVPYEVLGPFAAQNVVTVATITRETPVGAF